MVEGAKRSSRLAPIYNLFNLVWPVPCQYAYPQWNNIWAEPNKNEGNWSKCIICQSQMKYSAHLPMARVTLTCHSPPSAKMWFVLTTNIILG